MIRILNIGSLNIDKVYSVQNFVQPKETIKASRYEEFCGGKGLNQSIALAKAGAEVYHAGAVGRDGMGLLSVLQESGVHTEYIQQLDSVSGHAVIQVDQTGQNNIVIYGGTNSCVGEEHINVALDNFTKGDILLVQNEISNVGYAIRKAKERGMIVMLNPSPYNREIEEYPLEMVDCFLLNEVEGRKLAKVSSEEPERIIQGLREAYSDAAFVLTLGEEGSYFFDRERMICQEVFKVDTVDTTGAGDTFSGYFIAGIAAGLEIEQVMRQASAASGISVSRKGASTSIPSMEEVKKMIG